MVLGPEGFNIVLRNFSQEVSSRADTAGPAHDIWPVGHIREAGGLGWSHQSET